MSAAAVEKLVWDPIDTVLPDLDGTLLDLGFDNDFWLDFIRDGNDLAGTGRAGAPRA
jgi:hypothetical protein